MNFTDRKASHTTAIFDHKIIWMQMYLMVQSLILGITLPSQEIYMQNYLSIGVDALVTYNFHKARESPFYVMSSRLINKFIYFSYGTKDVLERECRNLNKVQWCPNKMRIFH